jgi:hypothetical protein
VKLTWDEDDAERNKVTRRNLTRQEIEDGDFRAYIASSSGSESEGESSKPRKDKKANRDKLRALLLGGNEEAMPEGWGEDNNEDVDMEITFTPGLLGKTNDEDETTLEKYQRKMREKRKKRKEEVKDKVTSKGKEREVEDDFFEGESEEGDASDGDRHHAASKGKKKKGSEIQMGEVNRRGQEATTEELALLVSSNNPDADPEHFDFKAVLKAEKGGKRKKKGKKEKHGEDETQQDFVLDVQDERFKVLHEDHQFAIDPSNPQYVLIFRSVMSCTYDVCRSTASRKPRECPHSWTNEENETRNGIPNQIRRCRRILLPPMGPVILLCKSSSKASSERALKLRPRARENGGSFERRVHCLCHVEKSMVIQLGVRI